MSTPPSLQRLCVYCGSSEGRQPAYAQAARQLAHALVERHIQLVYGGASVACGLLNVAGYYNSLQTFLQHTVQEQFVKPTHYDMLLVEEQPTRLLERFVHYQAPIVNKWIQRNTEL